jgi:hypothetical protein
MRGFKDGKGGSVNWEAQNLGVRTSDGDVDLTYELFAPGKNPPHETKVRIKYSKSI